MVQQPSDVHFATVSLSTDAMLHYAERGDQKGKPSSSSTHTPTRGSPSAGCCLCSRLIASRLRPRPARPYGLELT